MCREAARLGLKGFDLIPAGDWPTLNKYGLIPTMAPASGVTIADGLNNRANHDAIEKSMRAALGGMRGRRLSEPDHLFRQPARHA